MASSRVWSSADLASALGCTEPEAEAVLWSFGFAHSPSYVWRLADDEESKFLRDVYGLGHSVTGASPEQVRQVLDLQTRRYLNSGQASGIEWQDLPWLHTSSAMRTVARRARQVPARSSARVVEAQGRARVIQGGEPRRPMTSPVSGFTLPCRAPGRASERECWPRRICRGAALFRVPERSALARRAR